MSEPRHVCPLPTLAGLALAAALAVPAAQASFITPDGVNEPWVRGVTADSTFAAWESYSNPAGPNNPDAGYYNNGLSLPASDANVFDSSGGSFITGGHIYSFSTVPHIHVIIPALNLGPAYTTTVILQVHTLGNEIDPASINIGGVAPDSHTELSRVSLGSSPTFGGFDVENLYTFTLSGNAASYEIDFNASDLSMSTADIAIDTFATPTIPAPGAAAALGLGVIAAGRRRRR